MDSAEVDAVTRARIDPGNPSQVVSLLWSLSGRNLHRKCGEKQCSEDSAAVFCLLPPVLHPTPGSVIVGYFAYGARCIRGFLSPHRAVLFFVAGVRVTRPECCYTPVCD